MDAIVCGDGEQAIVEIARGRPLVGDRRLGPPRPRGTVVFNRPRANVPLDDNLMPARELRRHPYYLTSKGVSTGIKVFTRSPARGVVRSIAASATSPSIPGA